MLFTLSEGAVREGAVFGMKAGFMEMLRRLVKMSENE